MIELPATEIRLKAWIGNPIDRITERHMGVRIWTWCNFQQDVHELESENPEQLDKALTEFREHYKVLEESRISDNARFLTQNCICTPKTTVHDNIGDLEILNLMPVLCEGGAEYYRLIAFRHEALAELYGRLEAQGFRVEVVEQTPFNGLVSDTLVPLNTVVGRLTERQVDAIVSAYNSGYYQTPRRVNVQEIASRAGVPRTTLQEHLNKAENKLIASIVPQIQLYSRKRRRVG